MYMQAASEEDAFVNVAVNVGSNKGYSFKTHPNIDKNLYNTQNILALRDPERPFPSGSPVGILKWRMQVLRTLSLLLAMLEAFLSSRHSCRYMQRYQDDHILGNAWHSLLLQYSQELMD